MYYVEAEGVVLGYCDNLAVAVKLARRHSEVFAFAVDIKVKKDARLAMSLSAEELIDIDIREVA